MLSLVTGEKTDILIHKAAPIADPLAPEIQALIPEMIEAMYREKGVGLAAPQIGKPIQLAVLEVDRIVYTLINPVITTSSQTQIVSEEGCLSLPGKFFPIERAETITVKYQNEKGLPKKLRADGFLSIVIQHEVDHLNGILICHRFKKQSNT